MWHPVLFACFCVLTPVALWSQESAKDETGLRVSRLATVHVQLAGEEEVSGKLLSFEDGRMLILVGEEQRRFELANVLRVQREGDSIKNGAVIGSLVGIAMGIVAGGIADCVDDRGRVGGCGTGARIGMAAMSALVYAGAGAGIDALIPGRTTLYEAPSSRVTSPPSAGFRARFSVTW